MQVSISDPEKKYQKLISNKRLLKHRKKQKKTTEKHFSFFLLLLFHCLALSGKPGWATACSHVLTLL